ncbi:MAG: hypothetical protein ACE361_17015 [Aureliella sp.]
MGKLSDILKNHGGFGDFGGFDFSEPIAGEDDILPPGWYVADITQGEAVESRSKGTPGYCLTFVVAEGDYNGRKLWHELWFTPKSMSRSRRDLKKLGVPVDSLETMLAALDNDLPAIFRCNVKLGVRKDDDGNERNQIRRFEVVEVVERQPDDFAPEAGSDD